MFTVGRKHLKRKQMLCYCFWNKVYLILNHLYAPRTINSNFTSHFYVCVYVHSGTFPSHHHQVNDILAPTQQYSRRVMSQYHLTCLCWTMQLIKRATIKDICINQMRIILSCLHHMCHMAYVFHSIIKPMKTEAELTHMVLFLSCSALRDFAFDQIK